jgi:DNA-directed RNA polymerase subunit M/transcription elongation factor TFIIS
MSFANVCHGCGARLTVPDDYPRNKMQCPACGVFCQIEPRPAAKNKAAERQAAEDADRSEEDEPVTPVRSAPPPSVMTFREMPAGKGLATCPDCGEMVRAPAHKRGRREKCPLCGAAWPVPAAPPKPPPLPLPPLPDEFAGSNPDQDPETSNPYRTADAGSRRCPGCSAQLGPEVVVCVRCGFDLRLGRKVVKEYQEFERSWDSGMPLRTRLVLFLFCQPAALIAATAGLVALDVSVFAALPTIGLSWLVYTSTTAFLLGTFDHSELKRYRSGRVDLVRKWHVGFIPWPAKKIHKRDYSGVVTGVTYIGLWEWLVFLMLLSCGIAPGLVYWYCVIYKIEYTVALSKDREIPEIYVYRGWSEEQMHEIKQTLRDAMTV